MVLLNYELCVSQCLIFVAGSAYCSEIRPAAGFKRLLNITREWTLQRLSALIIGGQDDIVELGILDEGNFERKIITTLSKRTLSLVVPLGPEVLLMASLPENIRKYFVQLDDLRDQLQIWLRLEDLVSRVVSVQGGLGDGLEPRSQLS